MAKEKVDYKCNLWLAEDLVIHSGITSIIRAAVPQFENNGVDDIWFSAGTNEKFSVGIMENKTIKKQRELKNGENFREWYSTNNPDGIMRWLKGEIPSDKNIYFVNAEDINGNPENGKWEKMLASAASLCFMAVDGYSLFGPRTLKEAFLGYAYFLNRYHCEEFNKRYEPKWEKKALIDLDKGLYIRSHGPLEMYL